jgi:hypothetical protein
MRFYASILILLLVAAAPYNADPGRYKGPSQHTVTGPQAHGFALALTADSSTVTAGQPLWVTLEIRNISGSRQYASTFARGDGQSFLFSIVNQATHLQAPFERHGTFGADSIGGPLIGKPIPAGTSMFLKFDLSDLYNIARTGKYIIRAAAVRMRVNGQIVTMPSSNTITVTVT